MKKNSGTDAEKLLNLRGGTNKSSYFFTKEAA